MDKRFWAFLVVIALILSGIFFFTNTKKADAPAATKGTVTEHVEGSNTTGVTLVEYGDFQCPACSQYSATVKQVTEKYATRISFQYRNFPLFQLHPNAIAAARAAEAADMQGKYWDMHYVLYANQSAWTPVSDPLVAFEQYATKLGLNLTKFKQDAKGTVANDRIQADIKEGNRLGVESTPTFFLNGKKLSIPGATLEAFSKVIDAEIAKKGGSAKAAPPASTEPPAATTETPAENPPAGQ